MLRTSYVNALKAISAHFENCSGTTCPCCGRCPVGLVFHSAFPSRSSGNSLVGRSKICFKCSKWHSPLSCSHEVIPFPGFYLTPSSSGVVYLPLICIGCEFLVLLSRGGTHFYLRAKLMTENPLGINTDACLTLG